MKLNRRIEIIDPVLSVATDSAKARLDHYHSPTGARVRQRNLKFAARILEAAEKLETVEDMVFFEQTLQQSDFLMAHSDEDKNSILAARKSYEKFTKTLEQMRKDPDGYFRMNMGNREYNGDPHDVIKANSLDHIASNITRMRNRKQFATDSEKEIWDARIAMAKKTADMFSALHVGLARDFISGQTADSQPT